MAKDKKEVIKLIKELKVKFIRLWFTDVLGFLKCLTITRSELEKALEEGMGFDGSSIEGFARIQESDMVALPDPSTFQILPWYPKEEKVARMFCDIIEPRSGRPFPGDPRYVLKKIVTKARKKGYIYHVGPELEFFYFRNNKGTEILDAAGYFDLTPLDMPSNMRKQTITALESMGVQVEYTHHEVAPSQHEIDLRHKDALTMADNVMTYRVVVKEIAQRNGAYATFMPKPIQTENGSGMHIHQSLMSVKTGKNAFFDKKNKYHLSKIARCFIAGQLKHAREITSVINQWVNSYKRLIPGFEAPVYISWAQMNRSALIRVPVYKPGNEMATRAEIRSPDPACNPYLAFAALLAAGLEGIERNYILPPPVPHNLYEMSEEKRAKLGIKSLPEDLLDAIRITEKSEFLKRALGDEVFSFFIRNRKEEWDKYKSQVTEYELKRYLPIL
ncbi:MAG: glutamine synthetase family protein [Candidatus Omnitrophota bacterium]|nr:glutamine synthetase family protein [Candidatus Omnitrophota bacterium]